MQSQETRKRVIEVSIDMFNKYGCKAITMDKIASTLHISKRTLYELFDNKETLLLECITEVYRTLGKERATIINKTKEPFLMALFVTRNETALSMRYARILKDAEQYYPELTQRLIRNFTDRFKVVMYKILIKANEAGDLRPDVNVHDIVEVLTLNVHVNSVDSTISFETQEHLVRESCYTFMRGLLSVDAIKRYDKNEVNFKKIINN